MKLTHLIERQEERPEDEGNDHAEISGFDWVLKKGLDTLEQGTGLHECTQLEPCDVGMAVLDNVLVVPQLHRTTLMTFSCDKQNNHQEPLTHV